MKYLLIVVVLLASCGGGGDEVIDQSQLDCKQSPQLCVYDNPGKTNPPKVHQ